MHFAHSWAGEAREAPVVHRAFGRSHIIGLIMVYKACQAGTGSEASLAGGTPVHAVLSKTELRDSVAQESFIAHANFATISRNYWEGRDSIVIRHKLNTMNQQIPMSREVLWQCFI